MLTDPQGNIKVSSTDSVRANHPFYYTKLIRIAGADSTMLIELNKKPEIQVTEDQLSEGLNVMTKHHVFLPLTSTTYQNSFEFLSTTKIDVFQQSKEATDQWAPLNSVETIEKNRFK